MNRDGVLERKSSDGGVFGGGNASLFRLEHVYR